MKTPALENALKHLGIPGVAAACKVAYPTAYKWSCKRRLPRTEWTGETDYASLIVKAMAKAGHRIKRDDLLVLVADDAEVTPPAAPAASDQSTLAFVEAQS